MIVQHGARSTRSRKLPTCALETLVVSKTHRAGARIRPVFLRAAQRGAVRSIAAKGQSLARARRSGSKQSVAAHLATLVVTQSSRRPEICVQYNESTPPQTSARTPPNEPLYSIERPMHPPAPDVVCGGERQQVRLRANVRKSVVPQAAKRASANAIPNTAGRRLSLSAGGSGTHRGCQSSRHAADRMQLNTIPSVASSRCSSQGARSFGIDLLIREIHLISDRISIWLQGCPQGSHRAPSRCPAQDVSTD